MSKYTTGVMPVHAHDFLVSTTGPVEHKEESLAQMKPVKDIETMDPAIDSNIEEWNPLEAEGWRRALKTGGGMTLSASGKRNIGDPGNDYIAGLALKTGQAANTTLAVKFPNGDIMFIDGVISVSKFFGGDSTSVSGLEFEIISDGKPTYTAHAEG